MTTTGCSCWGWDSYNPPITVRTSIDSCRTSNLRRLISRTRLEGQGLTLNPTARAYWIMEKKMETHIGYKLGLYWDNGKENGNYYRVYSGGVTWVAWKPLGLWQIVVETCCCAYG